MQVFSSDVLWIYFIISSMSSVTLESFDAKMFIEFAFWALLISVKPVRIKGQYSRKKNNYETYRMLQTYSYFRNVRRLLIPNACTYTRKMTEQKYFINYFGYSHCATVQIEMNFMKFNPSRYIIHTHSPHTSTTIAYLTWI